MLAPPVASLVFVGAPAVAARIRAAIADARMLNDWHEVSGRDEALHELRGHEDEPPLLKPYLVLLQAELPNALALVQELRDTPDLRKTVIVVLAETDDPHQRHAFYQHNVAGYALRDSPTAVVDLIKKYLHVVTMPL